MLPIAWYLLKVIICSGILFGYYWFLLRNKIFHQYNRFYLLATIILSLVLPLIQINFWQQNLPTNRIVNVLQAVSTGDEYVNNVIIHSTYQHWDLQQLYPFIYLLISSIFLALFLRTLFTIYTLLKKYPAQIIDKVTFVKTDDNSTPFSFLNFIFWNNNIDPETTTGKQIFMHEVAHVQEKHTHDKLFINMVILFGWSNPFFWLIRKELNMIHEFIADKKAIGDNDTAAFAAMILKATYPRHHFPLTNNFFYSPIKRRLLMLTKSKNPRVNYLARIMVLPLAALIFTAFTLKVKKVETGYSGKKITVVIDAGHGGMDAGAKSIDGKFSEKDIALEIIKKIKALNTNDRINIILTREDDEYQSPRDKADFAKAQNADLFISVHLDKDPVANGNTKTGMAVWVSKDEFPNSPKSKVLAAAIINTFSNDYGLKVMKLVNQRNRGIWVLQNNTCPAVLIEAGFINNPQDLAYLKTEAAKETIAKNILAAIAQFENTDLHSNLATVSPVHVDTVPIPLIKNSNNSKPIYIVNGTQVTEIIANAISPNSILNVNVLKGKTAIEKYGTQAQNGVIEINTKNKDITGINNHVPTIAGTDYDVIIQASAVDLKNAPANMLYILNGKETDKADIDILKPADINDVRLIKNDIAIKVYGEKGKNGVFIINTKPGIFTSKWNADRVTVSSNANMNPNSRPLIIVDDKEYPGKTMDDLVDIIGEKQFKSVTILGKEEGEKRYGERGRDGIVLVTSKSVDAISSTNINATTKNTPRIFIGDLTKITTDAAFFKKQKEIRTTPGISFEEATIYFSGAGFQYVKTVQLKGSSLKPIEYLMNQCVSGTMVSFDNIRVKTATGKYMQLEGMSIALNGNDANNIDEKVFTAVEAEPKFPGDETGWRTFLEKNIDPTIPVKEGWKPGVYMIMLQFIVHTNGSISDISTTNYKESKTAQHCIDIIKKSPNWIPALQNGMAVNAYRKQPITFVIEESK